MMIMEAFMRGDFTGLHAGQMLEVVIPLMKITSDIHRVKQVLLGAT